MLASMIVRQTSDSISLFKSLCAELSGAVSGQMDIAVFDADGTLWRADATETLLDTLEGLGLLRPPAGAATIADHLGGLYLQSYAAACEFCARIFRGQRLEDVLRWSESSFAEHVYQSMVPLTSDLVRWLHARKVEVHVVTASPWWAVVPGTRRLGIPDSQVHGLQVEITDGVFSGQMVGRLQSGPGKAATVDELSRAPVFVAGNTVDDAAMMELSTCTALAVEPMLLADDRRDLSDIARHNNWYVLERTS